MQKIILASQSPRRRELIGNITTDFEVIVSPAEERLPEGLAPEDAPAYLARLKAAAVARDYPDRLVIGADTIVLLGDRLLGKPKDADDARDMLRLLSGRSHTVITGCCLMLGGRERSFSQSTRVEFYPLTDREIDGYIATGEPFDKAGAYGIQGKGMLLVKGVEGDYFNVMGLPVGMLSRELRDFTAAQDIDIRSEEMV